MRVQSISFSASRNINKLNANYYNVAFTSKPYVNCSEGDKFLSTGETGVVNSNASIGDDSSTKGLVKEARQYLFQFEKVKNSAADTQQNDNRIISDVLKLVQDARGNNFDNIVDSTGTVVKRFHVRKDSGETRVGTIIETDIPGIDMRKSFFNKGKLVKIEEYRGIRKNVILLDKKQRLNEHLESLYEKSSKVSRGQRRYKYSSDGRLLSCDVGFQVGNHENARIAKSFVLNSAGQLASYEQGVREDSCDKSIAREFTYQNGQPKYYFEKHYRDYMDGLDTNQKRVNLVTGVVEGPYSNSELLRQERIRFASMHD